MSYYSPRREVKLRTEEKGISKGMVFFAAFLTFVGSIFIGRWVGIKLMESRTGIKSPAAIEGYQGPEPGVGGPPPVSQSDGEPPRQNFAAPLLVIPPPVVEPKIPQAEPEKSSDEASMKTELSPATRPDAEKSKPKPGILVSKEKPPSKTGTPTPKVTLYKVQTGLFSTTGNAQELADHLNKQGYNASFESINRPDGEYYRVWVGPFNTRNEAESAAQDLNGDGYQAFVIEESGK